MQTAPKSPISPDQLDAIVRAHLGTDRPLKTATELKEGYFNTAYLIELSDGFRCVLKAAPPQSQRILTYEKNILKIEFEMITLAAERTEMPVPKLYGLDTTHQILASDYYLMEFLTGTPLHKLRPSLSEAEQTAIDHELGRLTRQLNTITGDAFGYPGQAHLQSRSWTEAFGVMLQTVLNDGIAVGAVIPRPYDQIYAGAVPHFEVLAEITVPRLVHWDLWDGNVFIHPETKRITGIIDFERALWGDPLMEATLGDMRDDIPFIQGYGQPLFDNPSKIRRRHLYNLYLFLIMVIEAYYRDYVESDITLWARGRLNSTLEALQI
ncbi:MAG: aminoglycoside phosphotransferase family protein [Anaerolinea sp.]|nr:aminoglycoside phosphotransferase family protein [Anaerolinea sp.]